MSSDLRKAQDRRREALIERIGAFADLLASEPLPGIHGDVAYDLLRQAAAQLSSDRLRITSLQAGQDAPEPPTPSPTIQGDSNV